MVVAIVVDFIQSEDVSFGFNATAGELNVSLSDSPTVISSDWPSFDVKAVNIYNSVIGLSGVSQSSAFNLYLHIVALDANSNIAQIRAALGKIDVYPSSNESKPPDDDETSKINFFGLSFSVQGFIGSLAGGAGALSLIFVCCCCCCCCSCEKNPLRCCCPAKPKTSSDTPSSEPEILPRSESTENHTQVSNNPVSYDDNSQLSNNPLSLESDNNSALYDPSFKKRETQPANGQQIGNATEPVPIFSKM